MNIYLITLTDKVVLPSYADYNHTQVVIAESEERARKLILEDPENTMTIADEGSNVWLSPTLSHCRILGITNQDKEEIVITAGFSHG